MVLDVAYAVVSTTLPSKYYSSAIAGIVIIYAIRVFTQGRKTTRERDLHARVVLVTGAFTSIGLTIVNSLAERGAHVIAISPEPINSPKVELLISLLRTTTNNEQIFAEECDLTSAESVRSLCTRFLTSENNRLDAIVFTHEYPHIGSIVSRGISVLEEKERQTRSLATFLMITLLLPILLVAPPERDIRILNIVNPFYAAAVTTFSPTPDASKHQKSIILREGRRSLQMIIITRHLQRILDSMPQGSHVPKTEENTVPIVNATLQRSNIVSVSVSPGISRTGTIAPLLAASRTDSLHLSSFGIFCYLILQPLLRIFTKSATAAHQTVLHALFLPTPFKSSPQSTQGQDELTTEVLKPGSLYVDCSVQNLKLRSIVEDGGQPAKGKGKEPGQSELPDDGELGGEVMGRIVWESFEQALNAWEKMSASKEDLSSSAGERGGDSIETRS